MKTRIISMLLLLLTCSIYGQISTNEKPIGLKLGVNTLNVNSRQNTKSIKFIKNLMSINC